MSIAHDIPFEAGLGHLPGPPVQNSGSQSQPLHRISDARRRQGISVRSRSAAHADLDGARPPAGGSQL